MFVKFGILSIALGIAGAAAQDHVQKAYQGQSWVGLLVASDCKAGASGAADRSKANAESDLTTHGRTTTPAVDASGTRGQSTELVQSPNHAGDKQQVPKTGDVLGGTGQSIDPGWAPAREQAKSLGDSCAIESRTARYALLMADGSRLEFDDVANQAIAKQAQSATGSGGKKILRVSVHGKLQNGKIALTSIQM